MPKPRLFDTMCYDLANFFLHQVPNVREEDINELASRLQETAEDFLSALQDPEEES